MQAWWATIKNFKPHEFDSPDALGSGVLMDFTFVYKLDHVRDQFGAPLKINSGYRTDNHNAAVGGKQNSAHRRGRAVDVSTVGWTESKKQRFIKLCQLAGFNRFGMGKTFIHVDNMTKQEGYPCPAVWTY